MSLWLCRQERVNRPFLVEPLGIHLYSSQELSYVIYHYPLLVLDGFVGENLFTFLREELNHGFLALKLERWMKSNEDPDEVLILILQECDYYTAVEIAKYRQRITDLRKKHPAEFKKLKADELFSMRQYGRAVKLYQELVDEPSDEFVNDQFKGRVWNNMGSCYARMFRFSEAMGAFEVAYLRTGQKEILERIYALTQLDDRLRLGDRLNALISEDMKKEWDEHLEAARKKAAQSEQIGQLNLLFQKDSIRRQEGEAALLKKWKNEYRSMV